MAAAGGGPGGVPESVADRRRPRSSCRTADTNGGPPAGRPAGSYASGARVLSIGIASTGIFTFAYLATASHVLSQRAYGGCRCAGR